MVSFQLQFVYFINLRIKLNFFKRAWYYASVNWNSAPRPCELAGNLSLAACWNTANFQAPRAKHFVISPVLFINNKHDSVRIYSICWSQLYVFLTSTIFSTILTNCSEIGPLYMTYSQIRSWYVYIRASNTRERPGSGNDLFCNIAMEPILVQFENGI